jgi:hypothetical protein
MIFTENFSEQKIFVGRIEPCYEDENVCRTKNEKRQKATFLSNFEATFLSSGTSPKAVFEL